MIYKVRLTSDKHAAMQHSINRLVRDMNSSTLFSTPKGVVEHCGVVDGCRLGGILSASRVWLRWALDSVSIVSTIGVLHCCVKIRRGVVEDCFCVW